MKEARITDKEFEPREGIDEAAGKPGGSSTARSRAPVARVWVAPERARWLREERTVVEELSDGAVVVGGPYGPTGWSARSSRMLGDLVALEPDDAREAVLAAVSAKRSGMGEAEPRHC